MTNPFQTPKYLERFGLKEAPYTTNPDERYLYLTDNHRDAIAMCGHIVENREGAGLIVGEQGTGKTTIMRRIASLMRSVDTFNVAMVETAEHSPTLFQLVKGILESFGVECVGQDAQIDSNAYRGRAGRSIAATGGSPGTFHHLNYSLGYVHL